MVGVLTNRTWINPYLFIPLHHNQNNNTMDNKPHLSKKRMVEWAGELKELYESAKSDIDFADCADAMADFIDEFLKVYNENK